MIINADYWSMWARTPMPNQSEKDSVNEICLAVDKAIKVKLARTIEKATFTLILDAPPQEEINLHRWAPIDPTGFLCYVNQSANGNDTLFTSTNLLTMYTDYTIVSRGESNIPFGPCVLRRNQGIWGSRLRRLPRRMASRLDKVPGAIKIVFTGGYEEVPEPIRTAACLAVSQMRSNRMSGMQIGTESWNGYSYNTPGVGLLTSGIMGNADIRSLLDPFVNYAAMLV